MPIEKQIKVRKKLPVHRAAAKRRPALATRIRRLREIQGKYSWIPFSSEDFIAEKHREIERER